MPLDKSKFQKIVGGITTPAEEPTPVTTDAELPEAIEPETRQGEGPASTPKTPAASPPKRFAKAGRPKGSPTGKSNKVKVTLFIDKTVIDDLYELAYQKRVQPGELFDQALRQFRDRKTKDRNAGTE